jgi:hypothetical protein
MSVVGGGESMVVIEVRINSFAGAEAEAVFKRTKAGLMQSMVPTALRGTSREGQGRVAECIGLSCLSLFALSQSCSSSSYAYVCAPLIGLTRLSREVARSMVKRYDPIA